MPPDVGPRSKRSADTTGSAKYENPMSSALNCCALFAIRTAVSCREAAAPASSHTSSSTCSPKCRSSPVDASLVTPIPKRHPAGGAHSSTRSARTRVAPPTETLKAPSSRTTTHSRAPPPATAAGSNDAVHRSAPRHATAARLAARSTRKQSAAGIPRKPKRTASNAPTQTLAPTDRSPSASENLARKKSSAGARGRKIAEPSVSDRSHVR